jgi:S-adenosylmethionine:tRNA ribosyltransferase-isomerase
MSDTLSPPTDLRTSDFDFDLPLENIAQQPVEPRDHARLLHVTPQDLTDHHIYDLPDLLRAGDLLVMNDTKVIPARLYGKRSGERLRGAQSEPKQTGEVGLEILLHKKQSPQTWLAFARPGKRLRVGDSIVFAADFCAEVLEKQESGEVLVRFSVADEKVLPLLQLYGEPPLPPYIKRELGAAKHDSDRYQTVYAAREGAVAAPTAGLHFTPELLARLQEKNIEHVKVTLHVGAGTFLPVKADRIKDHVMHAEWGEVSKATAILINKARQEGRRIVAVGTTSLRLLESAADDNGIIHPFAGDTAIFIYPGYRFKAVDALLTNFHLPKSTLFMLVCAFAGQDRMRSAYAHAIAHHYRFYSYGDATLLERAV